MASFAFTLYEVFGYLLPGGITLVALSIAYWSVFFPNIPAGIDSFAPGTGAWVIIVLVSYILGHASQAIGNRILSGSEAAVLAMKQTPWLRKKAYELSGAMLSINPAKIKARLIHRIVDEYVGQHAKPGDRDIYIYREGYYRGCSVGLFLLSLCLLLRARAWPTVLRFSKWTYIVPWYATAVTAALVALLGWLYFERYKRFVEYRITRAVLCAMVIRNTEPKTNEGENN